MRSIRVFLTCLFSFTLAIPQQQQLQESREMAEIQWAWSAAVDALNSDSGVLELGDKISTFVRECERNIGGSGMDPSMIQSYLHILLKEFHRVTMVHLSSRLVPENSHLDSAGTDLLTAGVASTTASCGFKGHPEAIRRLIEAGEQFHNVLDIGAHRGKWTEAMMEAVLPRAEYTLVEPNPMLMQVAERNVTGKVFVYRSALSHSVLEKTFYSNQATSSGAAGDSLFQERTATHRQSEQRRLMTETLSSLFGPSSTFDLIKIDVQGAELDVMRGGVEIVRRARCVILETPVLGRYNAGAPSFVDYARFMDDLGFTPFEFLERHEFRDAQGSGFTGQVDMAWIPKDSKMLERAEATILGIGGDAVEMPPDPN